MARKAVRAKGPQILKFEIHALGRLDDIVIHNKTGIHEGVIRRQLAFLKKGKPISAKDVQRAAGLVTDLSGVEAVVVSEPGTAPGTAVLHVTVLPDKSPRGDFSIDNYGSRYLGYGEEMFNYDIRNLTHEGDSLFTHIETTGHKYTNGTIMYRRPIGKNGLSMNIGYSQLWYSQGAEFGWLQPHGSAKTFVMGVEYPVHRSQTHDLKVGLEYEYLDLKDEFRRGNVFFPGPPVPANAYSVWNDKHANAVTLSVTERNLDKHGMTTWNLSYKYGHVSFDSDRTHMFFDRTNCEGAYSKVTGVFLRHQKLNERLALQLFARGQLASRNMDTSGRMGITGITGVKAYPISEVAGDNAYFTRAELQWTLPLQAKEQKLQLLTYLEHGGIKMFKDPVDKNEKNHRYLQDIGLGLLWSKKDAWWVRADYAWKLGSEKPTSDINHTNGHFWIQGGFYF
jgi:hemolysin activation/secretion protein